MGRLTLVPEALAAPGYRFTFMGANRGSECEGCPFQRLCFSLTPGTPYVVTALRDVTHPCNLHDGDRVRVVEVEPTTFETSLERKLLRGTAATWRPMPCGMPECPKYKLCHPMGPIAREHYAIVDTAGKLECPAGYDLEKVTLKPLQS